MYRPDEVSPPGETLLEAMEERGISLQTIAELAGIEVDLLQGIVEGQPISAEIAQRLENTLGIPQRFWLNRDKTYQEDKNVSS